MFTIVQANVIYFLAWFFFQLFAGLNGLLLPGGSAPLVGPGGYAEVGMIFFQLAKEVTNPFCYTAGLMGVLQHFIQHCFICRPSLYRRMLGSNPGLLRKRGKKTFFIPLNKFFS
jgi:hypothetical protein